MHVVQLSTLKGCAYVHAYCACGTCGAFSFCTGMLHGLWEEDLEIMFIIFFFPTHYNFLKILFRIYILVEHGKN